MSDDAIAVDFKAVFEMNTMDFANIEYFIIMPSRPRRRGFMVNFTFLSTLSSVT